MRCRAPSSNASIAALSSADHPRLFCCRRCRSWLLNPVNGLFNEVLVWFGLPTSMWHLDPDLALLSVSVVTFWKSFGLNMLLWIAALANVPQSLREASRLDGAGAWRRFFTIELPLITPTAFSFRSQPYFRCLTILSALLTF
ncbi:hypothetical protein DEA98_18910 [Brucella pseudogrignonensis]|nr:hypothetical protein [Brucella pseudogrignonensis]